MGMFDCNLKSLDNSKIANRLMHTKSTDKATIHNSKINYYQALSQKIMI